MKECYKLVKKRQKTVNFGHKKSQTSENWIWTIKLVKLLQKASNQIKMLEMVYDPTTTIALKFINLQYNLIISYMKLVIEFVGVDRLEHFWAGRNSRICLDIRGLQTCRSDRYHLTASAMTRVCPSMMDPMLWITSFSRCSMSLLLLLLNDFLKMRIVYFKAESTISGAF